MTPSFVRGWGGAVLKRREATCRERELNPHWSVSESEASTKLGYHGVSGAGPGDVWGESKRRRDQLCKSASGVVEAL